LTQIGDDEPAKKRKIEPEQKARSEIKKVPQPSRPLTASTSSQHVPIASSQKMGPPSTLNKSYGPSSALNKSTGPSSSLNKSTGASSMIGKQFMSAQIRLPEQQGVARPGPTVPKPFGISQSALRPPQPHHTPKPDPEPYQELPEIDSEYSDSDDEAHEKKVASFPQWAQSPALSHALMEQRKVNPDDIFGPIPALSIQGASLCPVSFLFTADLSFSPSQKSSARAPLPHVFAPVRPPHSGRAPTLSPRRTSLDTIARWASRRVFTSSPRKVLRLLTTKSPPLPLLSVSRAPPSPVYIPTLTPWTCSPSPTSFFHFSNFLHFFPFLDSRFLPTEDCL
jgi:hypothetical protein